MNELRKYFKYPDDVLTAPHYNALQLLCRIGATKENGDGLVYLEESKNGSTIRGSYLFPQAGLIDFECPLEEGITKLSSPVDQEPWSIEFADGPGPWRSRLRFNAFTAQPLLFCDEWLLDRLQYRHEEIHMLKLRSELGGLLCQSLEEISRLAKECPVQLSYHELKRTWRACILGITMPLKAQYPEQRLRATGDSRHEFRILEEALAIRIWLERYFDTGLGPTVKNRYQQFPAFTLRRQIGSGGRDRMYATV